MKPFITQSIVIQSTEFILHPLRFLYWPAQKTIVCADIHIGKGAHFRNNGIRVPKMLNKNNFWNLAVAFSSYEVNRLLIVGDMVHSTENEEWQEFADFLANYPSLQKTLVRGNHEILEDEVYAVLGFEVCHELNFTDFCFTHEPKSDVNEKYCISGHIHPAIVLQGGARQRLRVPCFYFNTKQGILPSFGEFTGSHSLKPKRGDLIYAITDNEVIRVGADS